MISAVAARKAALASQVPISYAKGEEDSKGSSPIFIRLEDQTSKRKPSQKFGKKARKSKPFDKRKLRTGVSLRRGNISKEQRDFIAVDSDGEDDRTGKEDPSTLEDTAAEDADDTMAEPASRKNSSNSSLDDSSGDEDNVMTMDAGMQLDVSALLPHLSYLSCAQEGLDEEGIPSTFQPKPDNNIFFLSESECSSLGLTFPSSLVCMTKEDTLCLLGTCGLKVLRGSLNFLGANLQASPIVYQVFSSRYSPLATLQPGNDCVSSTHPNEHIPHRLRHVLHKFDTVFALQRLDSGVERLGEVCRPFQGMFEPSRWQKNNTCSPFAIHNLYMVSKSMKDLSPFVLPASWLKAFDTIVSNERNKDLDSSSPGVYLVKGPKNSGKSTFARILVNHLLNLYRYVAFLECDLGQSEFTPAGMVALNVISQPIFGPPFSHPTLPNYAHFIGSTTPRSSPSHYVDAITTLIQTYRRELQIPVDAIMDSTFPSSEKIIDHIPLVVNTMGWVKGLGADLNKKIENIVQPTDILDIQVPKLYPGTSSNLPMDDKSYNACPAYSSGVFLNISTKLHILEPVLSTPSTFGHSATDYRNISILSYFHAIFPNRTAFNNLEQITAHKWNTSRPLCAMPPFEVDCGIAFDKVILTGAGSEDVVEDEIGRVLNGAVVGLVAYDPSTDDEETDSEGRSALKASGIPYTRGRSPPSPEFSYCVGLGIVRGVSPPLPSSVTQTKTYLQLLTPLPRILLDRPRVLVKGELELPIWGMLDFRSFDGEEIGNIAGVELENVPYLQRRKAIEGVFGAEKRRVRRNLMRKSQM